MKKLFLFIIVLLPVLLTAQNPQKTKPVNDFDDLYYSAPVFIPNNIPQDSTKSFIMRYSNTRITAYTLGTAGMVCAGFSLIVDEEMPKTMFLVAGVGFGLASYVTFVYAEKWLKKHAIELTGNGIVKRF